MNYTTSSYPLEITIKTAEALTIRNQKPILKNVFVTISIENNGYMNQIQTRLCDPSNTKPTWNEKLIMSMPTNVKFIILEVRYKRKSNDKFIGLAKVPTSDFVGNKMPLNYLHCLSYRLRDRDGEPNGIINFSVNVKRTKLDSQFDGNYNSKDKIEIHGFNCRENYCAPPKLPWAGSTLLGDRSKNTATVVGVPAAW
ncbi:BON1-associated protein 1-like [Amaranthus tricolor]|uniref:BON1-associated protein 1-like n=1 Tax=Amaranthus tricolor TaxID=29722 RepID=UPI002584920C|nr:BON1-associated protein 1-like [Amaranthus tricolor]